MAIEVLGSSFGDLWPPDTLAGGVIQTRTANAMSYLSDMGFIVTLTGTGLLYDSAGFPRAGTVTGMTLEKDGVTFATLSGSTVDMAQARMLLFGYDRQNGGHQFPDPYAFLQNFLRGDDVLTGSAFDDDMRGGTGNDLFNAGDGDDYIGVEGGNDTVDGGNGYDSLGFDEANYRWDTTRGVDLDAATGLATTPWGGTLHFSQIERFKDSLFSDTLRGSSADETFVVSRGSDVIDGRGGFDEVRYDQVDRWGAVSAVVVNLATGQAIDSWGDTDSLAGIEAARGSIFGDTLIGSGRANELEGWDGNDLLQGGKGADRLWGDWGRDTIQGGAGADTMSGGGDSDRLTGSAGADDFLFDWALGDSGVDVITDFAHGVDEIWVTADWGGGFAGANLVAAQLRSGAGVTTASTAAQRFIYNTTTGDLYFDPDGVGGVTEVRFATLTGQPTLTAGDIHIIL